MSIKHDGIALLVADPSQLNYTTICYCYHLTFEPIHTGETEGSINSFYIVNVLVDTH